MKALLIFFFSLTNENSVIRVNNNFCFYFVLFHSYKNAYFFFITYKSNNLIKSFQEFKKKKNFFIYDFSIFKKLNLIFVL